MPKKERKFKTSPVRKLKAVLTIDDAMPYACNAYAFAIRYSSRRTGT